MDELPKRLRHDAEEWEALPFLGAHIKTAALLRAAADEIDRLRGALSGEHECSWCKTQHAGYSIMDCDAAAKSRHC